MLTIYGRPRKVCSGMTRRELLSVGGISLFGSLTLPNLLRAARIRSHHDSAPAKSVVLLNLFGGPPHIDMFDLKPDAPAEVRGEFKPIATSVPGRGCD